MGESAELESVEIGAEGLAALALLTPGAVGVVEPVMRDRSEEAVDFLETPAVEN